MRIHWHRRDLRISDNPALAAAAGPVLGLFVIDGVTRTVGPPQRRFLGHALRSLRNDYQDRGGELYIRDGDPTEILPSFLEHHRATGISWEADYGATVRTRDESVATNFDALDIDPVVRDGRLLHSPGDITTNAGDPYKVFTHFGRKWLEREKQDPVTAPEDVEIVSTDPGAVDTLMCEVEPDIPEGGTAAARERLQTFCDGPIFRYDTLRDRPAAEGTSRLSQDLAVGTIGIREVWEATVDAANRADADPERDAVEAFQRQLTWREFYTTMLDARPDMVDTNLIEFERPIEWRTDPAALDAWKRGMTGFPIVDAGMRQLRQEGFMHNRVRMIAASFLTKDLLIDWREGLSWFRERLVDHDTANNAGGWQWGASTGTDAQPYFRVFNPMSQAERYDPDAWYIRRHVEELTDAPTRSIHQWPELDPDERGQLAPEYPEPIVDHQSRREAALAMYRTARGESGE